MWVLPFVLGLLVEINIWVGILGLVAIGTLGGALVGSAVED